METPLLSFFGVELAKGSVFNTLMLILFVSLVFYPSAPDHRYLKRTKWICSHISFCFVFFTAEPPGQFGCLDMDEVGQVPYTHRPSRLTAEGLFEMVLWLVLCS